MTDGDDDDGSSGDSHHPAQLSPATTRAAQAVRPHAQEALSSGEAEAALPGS